MAARKEAQVGEKFNFLKTQDYFAKIYFSCPEIPIKFKRCMLGAETWTVYTRISALKKCINGMKIEPWRCCVGMCVCVIVCVCDSVCVCLSNGFGLFRVLSAISSIKNDF
jgi:hypothetical protein